MGGFYIIPRILGMWNRKPQKTIIVYVAIEAMCRCFSLRSKSFVIPNAMRPAGRTEQAKTNKITDV